MIFIFSQININSSVVTYLKFVTPIEAVLCFVDHGIVPPFRNFRHALSQPLQAFLYDRESADEGIQLHSQ